jgi:hypothetical protein
MTSVAPRTANEGRKEGRREGRMPRKDAKEGSQGRMPRKEGRKERTEGRRTEGRS